MDTRKATRKSGQFQFDVCNGPVIKISFAEWFQISLAEWFQVSFAEWFQISFTEWFQISFTEWFQISLAEWFQISFAEWFQISFAEWFLTAVFPVKAELAQTKGNNVVASILLSQWATSWSRHRSLLGPRPSRQSRGGVLSVLCHSRRQPQRRLLHVRH